MIRPRSAVLLVAVCLLAVGFLASPAATTAVDGLDRSVSQSEDGPSYASPDASSIREEGYESVSMNLGAAVQRDAQALRTEHERRVLDDKLAAAINDSATTYLAEQRLAEIEQRYERLEDRERELLQAYADRQISAQLFLSQWATLRSAVQMQSSLQEQAASEVQVPERVLNLEGALLIDGPVTERVRSAQRTVGDTPFYILTGEESAVLATIDDGRFFRQATLRENRDLTVGTEADQFRVDGEPDFGEVSARAAELYPWVFEDNLRESVAGHASNSKVYLATAGYSRGELRAYLDGATTEVFQEIHEQPLDRVAFASTATNGTADLNVTVERTQETGPMRVTVTDGEQPLEGATVQTDEQSVGVTDDDGQLWLVEPRIATTLAVTAADGDRVTVSI